MNDHLLPLSCSKEQGLFETKGNKVISLSNGP